MFGSIGGTELLVIMVIALVVFGPKRLPELGRTIGKGLGEFRRASNDLRRSLEDEIALDDRKRRDPDDD
jgi:TatA/E family protein of Tat protein translocase